MDTIETPTQTTQTTGAAQPARAPRRTANPRRLTLAHLADAAEFVPAAAPAGPAALPDRVANPRRTWL